GRLEDASFEGDPIRRLDFYQFVVAKAIFLPRIHRIRIKRASQRAVGAIESNLGRRSMATRRVDEKVPLRADAHLVVAGRVGQTLELAAVELDTVEVGGNRTVLVRGEIDPSFLLVNGLQGARLEHAVFHFPGAVRHSALQLARRVKVIEM